MSSDETSEALERAKAGTVEPAGLPSEEIALASAREAQPARSRAVPGRRGLPLLRIGIVFVLLGSGVYLLLGIEESPFVYSYTVDEVLAEPSAHLGRTLRVEGQLRTGSVLFREEPCEWRFVLEREGRQMPVEFGQCVVPDTFRDGMGISVVVEGRLREDGSFVASQVIPRCPSRYEMEQRQQAGEAMPHPPPPETSSLGARLPPT